MIAAFSTSSPVISVALFSDSGELLAHQNREARYAASEACIDLLQESIVDCGAERHDLTGFVADIGPGSFTGTRVAVVMAKTLGFLYGCKVGGIGAESLIHPTKTVVMPSKRDEWFIFRGGKPDRSSTLPDEAYCGFGPGIEQAVYPSAERCGLVWDRIEWSSAVDLAPRYWIDPSISVPKKRFPEFSGA